jgi:hypothetical protein
MKLKCPSGRIKKSDMLGRMPKVSFHQKGDEGDLNWGKIGDCVEVWSEFMFEHLAANPYGTAQTKAEGRATGMILFTLLLAFLMVLTTHLKRM